MPTSLPIFDQELKLYFEHAVHETVLDIGPGEGKFGRLVQSVQPSTRRIAVEVDPGYVEQFGLRDIYDEVLVMDACRLLDTVRVAFGAVIIGDVIEHLPKSAGVDLLNFLVYRSQVIFVKFPVQMMQDDHGGHASEAHVSVWSEHDFLGFDHIFVERDPMQLAVIRGYRNDTIEWLPQSFIRALGYESCAAYYDELPQRWKRADRSSRFVRHGDHILTSLIDRGEKIIMIDEERSGLLEDRYEDRVPFLEKDGGYFGMPATDDEALAELDRQRRNGVKWLAIAQDAFWVIDFYPRLLSQLRSRHRCVVENEFVVVFQLV